MDMIIWFGIFTGVGLIIFTIPVIVLSLVVLYARLTKKLTKKETKIILDNIWS